jgi:hypothetical protein
LDQVQRVEDDLSDQLNSLSGAGVVDRSLKHAAAVSVGCDFDQVGGDRVVDELVVLGNQFVQTFLDDLESKAVSICPF